MTLYVAAYDVSCDRRRTRVATVLLGFGVRIQYSVFEVRLEPDELPALRRDVGCHLVKEDSFDLIPIDERRPEARLRWQRPPTDWSPVVEV